MTDEQLLESMEWYLTVAQKCGSVTLSEEEIRGLFNLVKNQKTKIDILIRKKETLRDEIAEKDAEIERLKNAYKQCAWERDVLGKYEAYREFAESVKQISKEVTVPYVADTSIQEHKTGVFYYGKEDFDNLLKELTEKNDKG